MNMIRPELIWELERRRRKRDADNRLRLTVPAPERAPDMSKAREVEYVFEFDQGED